MKKRFEHIDFLRAVAIIGVIAIHTLSYKLNNSVYYLMWNYLNFVVVSFVFCSGYVLTAIYKEKFRTDFVIASWFKKRISKLLIPFYIYLAVHYFLWMMFPQFFSGLGLQKNSMFIVKSVLLIGGVDLNWLPLLFLQLTFVFPFLVKGLHQKKYLYIYMAFSFLVTIYFTIFRFPYGYFRFVMWISWSVILLISMYIFSEEHTDNHSLQTIKRYAKWAAACAALFGGLMAAHTFFGRSFQLVDYKYPPGFYYILYGLSISFLILIIGELSIHKNQWIKTASMFFSKHSYSIYFIHYIALDFIIRLGKRQVFWSNPLSQFLVVLVICIGACAALDRIFPAKKKHA